MLVALIVMAGRGGGTTVAEEMRSFEFKEDEMPVTFQRNIGMLLLAVWLILYGLAGTIAFVLPAPLMAILALLSGVLILVGR